MAKNEQTQGNSPKGKRAFELIDEMEAGMKRRNLFLSGITVMAVILLGITIYSMQDTNDAVQTQNGLAEAEAIIEKLENQNDSLKEMVAYTQSRLTAVEEELTVVKTAQEPDPAENYETLGGGESNIIEHTVSSGESLWLIARAYFGDGNRYPEILNHNDLDNPDLIRKGQKLIIKN